MLMRVSSIWWADPNSSLSDGILKRLQWRSRCDTAGARMIFRGLPGASIFPPLGSLFATAPAGPLALAVCHDNDAATSANRRR
jgi:hypothetical protein